VEFRWLFPLMSSKETDRIVREYIRIRAQFSFSDRWGLPTSISMVFGQRKGSECYLAILGREVEKTTQREHVSANIWDNFGEFNV